MAQVEQLKNQIADLTKQVDILKNDKISKSSKSAAKAALTFFERKL